MSRSQSCRPSAGRPARRCLPSPSSNYCPSARRSTSYKLHDAGLRCPGFGCWDRRQTVNLVSAGGLVEQSNAAKNNAVDKLADSAAGRLAGWLAAGAARGWLAGWLLRLTGDWLAAGLLLLLLLLLAGSLAGWLHAAAGWLAVLQLLASWLAAWQDGCCC